MTTGGLSADATGVGAGSATSSGSEGADVDTATTDPTTTDAQTPYCGDGMIHPETGEECDDAGESASCNDACLLKTWSDPVLVQLEDGSGRGPQVGIDGAGTATVVWREYDGVEDSVWGNRYDAERGWSTATLLEDNPGGASSLRLSVGVGGDAIAVWRGSDGAQTGVHANRYDATTETWTGAVQVAPGGVHPQAAVDGGGNAVVLWQLGSSVFSRIRATSYDALLGSWGTTTQLQLDEPAPASGRRPQVAMNDDGNAVAVWVQGDEAQFSVWGSRRTALAQNWDMPVVLEMSQQGDAVFPEVAIDATGNAVAVWAQEDGDWYSMYANRYDVRAGEWGVVELLGTGEGHVLLPQVALDGHGGAIAVWHQSEGAEMDHIDARRYDAVTDQWSDTQQLAVQQGNDNWLPQLSVNDDGDAFVVWEGHDGTQLSIQAVRYDRQNDAWGDVGLVESDAESASEPQVAIGPNANAVAVWHRTVGQHSEIYAARFE